MADDDLQKIVSIAIAYISNRPRSEKEIRAYLVKCAKRLKISGNDIVKSAFARLKELGYADDHAYAQAFIGSRMRSRPKGERMILYELGLKGVSDEIIDAVCGENFKEQGQTEMDLARRIAQKKYAIVRKFPVLEQKRRLFGVLRSRGFPSSVIFRVIDEIVKNRYNEGV